MIILCNLPVLLAERRMKVADLIRTTGISKSTMHKIYNDQSSRIDFETMDKICEYLEVEVKKKVLVLMVFNSWSPFGHRCFFATLRAD